MVKPPLYPDVRKAIVAVMNRAGFVGTWDDAAKQVEQENKAWSDRDKAKRDV